MNISTLARATMALVMSLMVAATAVALIRYIPADEATAARLPLAERPTSEITPAPSATPESDDAADDSEDATDDTPEPAATQRPSRSSTAPATREPSPARSSEPDPAPSTSAPTTSAPTPTRPPSPQPSPTRSPNVIEELLGSLLGQ